MPLKYKNTNIEICIGDMVDSGSLNKRIVIGIKGDFVILRFHHNDNRGEFNSETHYQNVKFLFRSDGWRTVKDIVPV